MHNLHDIAIAISYKYVYMYTLEISYLEISSIIGAVNNDLKVFLLSLLFKMFHVAKRF